MRVLSRLLALACLITTTAPAAERVIWLAEIRGSINPASSDFLQSAIAAAEKDNAEALIVELDTPGGLLSSVREMAQKVDQARIPVVVYVTPAGASATSAGALLMFSSHVAAMAPGTNIGAAHPVGGGGEDIKGAMGEKITNDTAAFARGLADLRGRNRELAEAVVSKSKSFTAQEALKENLIEIIASSREELIQKLEGRKVKVGQEQKTLKLEGGIIKTAEMTRGQKLLHYLANPNIASILISLGMLLIYLELSNPGITVAGVLGGICLLVAFMALQLLPIRVGGVSLLLLGVVLMIAEVFVASGGALAAGGILSFILGLIWMVDPSETSFVVSPRVWVPIAVGMGAFVAMITTAAARMRSLSRKTLAEIGGGGVAGLAGYTGQVTLVAADGLHGKAQFRGEIWDIESSEPLKVGQEVVALKTEGFKITVKPAA